MPYTGQVYGMYPHCIRPKYQYTPYIFFIPCQHLIRRRPHFISKSAMSAKAKRKQYVVDYEVESGWDER